MTNFLMSSAKYYNFYDKIPKSISYKNINCIYCFENKNMKNSYYCRYCYWGKFLYHCNNCEHCSYCIFANNEKHKEFVFQTIEYDNIRDWIDAIINWIKRSYPNDNYFKYYDYDDNDYVFDDNFVNSLLLMLYKIGV